MPGPHPRLIALGAIRHQDRLLVSECRDAVSGERFFRPPGGGIAFGERAAQAVIRELDEELGVSVRTGRMLGTLESLFTYEGRPGHEIVLIVEAAFADPALYHRDSFPRLDRPGQGRQAVWLSLADVALGTARLVPDGLLTLLLASSPFEG